MSQAPTQPQIYHITHIQNLQSISNDGEIISDAQMIQRGGPKTAIGMSDIKQRRLKLPVKCHTGTYVGEYVPFYFCPRSVMLYVVYRGNHPDLQFRDGQEQIVHLKADLNNVIAWANTVSCRWAYSLSNAGAYYTEFGTGLAGLDRLDWAAIANTDFRDPDVKEGKQAEFLVFSSFPWSLVSEIAVYSSKLQTMASIEIASASHKPPIAVRREWYY